MSLKVAAMDTIEEATIITIMLVSLVLMVVKIVLMRVGIGLLVQNVKRDTTLADITSVNAL